MSKSPAFCKLITFPLPRPGERAGGAGRLGAAARSQMAALASDGIYVTAILTSCQSGSAHTRETVEGESCGLLRWWWERGGSLPPPLCPEGVCAWRVCPKGPARAPGHPAESTATFPAAASCGAGGRGWPWRARSSGRGRREGRGGAACTPGSGGSPGEVVFRAIRPSPAHSGSLPRPAPLFTQPSIRALGLNGAS